MAIARSRTDDFLYLQDGDNSHDEAGVAIGTAAADRLVFVKSLALTANSTLEITEMTIGGVTASRARRDVFTLSAPGNFMEYESWWALVPSGATATISFTHDADWAEANTSFLIYSVTGADTTSPVAASDFTSRADALANALSIDIDILAGGAALAHMGGPVANAGTVTQAWSGATEDFDDDFDSGSGLILGRSCASLVSASAVVDQTIAVTSTAASVTLADRAMQVFSLQPFTPQPTFQAHVVA